MHQQDVNCGREADISDLKTAVSIYEKMLDMSLERKLIQSINLMITQTCLDFHAGEIGDKSKETIENVSSYWNSYFERNPGHLAPIERYILDMIKNKRAETHKIHLPLGSTVTCGSGISYYYKQRPSDFVKFCEVTGSCNGA